MSPPLEVALVHTYRDEERPSMRLYAERLGQALTARGVLVEPVRLPSLVPRAMRRGVVSRADSLLGRFLRLPRHLGRVRSAVVHVVDHSQSHLLAGLAEPKTVVTAHDVCLLALAQRCKGAELRIAREVFGRSVAHLRRADAVIAVSESTKADLVRFVHVDPERIEVVYPGLNEAFRPRPELRERSRRRWGLRRATLLHVGQTDFYKNVEACLRVLARLRAGGLDAELVRAGERLRPGQRRLATRLGVHERVRDLGSLSADDLHQLYAAADVLLHPSLHEGFGWPPVEALACGLPVVASTAGSLPEVLAGAALLAPAEDVAALTDAVARVVSGVEHIAPRRELGLAVAARYTWMRSAEQAERIYRRLVWS